MTVEVRYAVCRYAGKGRRLSGVVVSYKDEAVIGGQFRERILPGALRANDVILNLSHDNKRPVARTGGGLELKDTKEAMTMRCELPKCRDADDALELVRSKVIRGLSVEMQVKDDDWSEGGRLRTIREAELVGIGLVSRPAYPQSSIDARDKVMASGAVGNLSGCLFDVELRNRSGRISGAIPYNEEAIVSMRYGKRQIIEPGAFNNINDGSDVYLLAGYDYAAALASSGAGSLRIDDKRDGLYFAMTKPMPKAGYARDFNARMKAGLVSGIVPGFVPIKEENIGDVNVVKEAMLCEINLVARSSAGGRLNNSPKVKAVRRWRWGV